MTGRDGSAELVVLRRCWRRWAALVELWARRRRARRELNPQAYHALHTELIQACRSLADTVDGSRRAFYQDLESLAQPWMTPALLEQADRQILFDLLTRCRQAEGELDGRAWAFAGRWAASGLKLVAVAAVLVAVTWTAPSIWLSLWHRAQTWWMTVWFAVQDLSQVQWFFIIAIIVVLAGIGLVSRTARS